MKVKLRIYWRFKGWKFRTYILSLLVVILFLSLDVSCQDQTASIHPVSLSCEYQEDPKGIDVRQPSLGWLFKTIDPELRRQKQTAYQILVSSDPGLLSEDSGDLWNSGWVESDQNTHIIYEGTPLYSRARCYWKVRVSDGEGHQSDWSSLAKWDMGLLEPSDWEGKWIGSKAQLDRKPRVELNGYHSHYSSSQKDIKWVQVDLEEITSFEKIVLHPALPMEYPNGQQAFRNPGYGFPPGFRIDISNDAKFDQFTTVVDKTELNFPNPGHKPVSFKFSVRRSRYIRVTATKLWKSNQGERPFCFSLGELQILNQERNIGLFKPAIASDSKEGFGWSENKLTDDLNVVGEVEKGHEAILFRKEAEIFKEIKHATAYISGLGYNELYINGKKVGNRVLDPGFTNYSKRVLYVTYDVSNFFKEGINTIGVNLGGGWYDMATPDAGDITQLHGSRHPNY